jgi:hypothetical protein
VNGELIEKLLQSKGRLTQGAGSLSPARKGEEEGGCGVVGFCCSEPVSARHIYEPSRQMHNRGNGKGGGIAAVGLVLDTVTRGRREVKLLAYLAHRAPGEERRRT